MKQGRSYSDSKELDLMTDVVVRLNEQDRITDVYTLGFNLEPTKEELAGNIKGRVMGDIKLGNEIKALDLKSQPFKLHTKETLEGKIIKIEDVN